MDAATGEAAPAAPLSSSWSDIVDMIELASLIGGLAQKPSPDPRTLLADQYREVWHTYAATLPRWPWARMDNRSWLEMADEEIVGAARRWDMRGHRGLVLLGATGVGKTSSLVARVHQVAANDLDAIQRTAADRRPPRFRWTTEVELVAARRQHPYGRGEAPAVDAIMRTPLAIIDDVGFGGQPGLMMEILDRRYHHRRPTVVTSGLTRIEWIERYGAAAWRRLTESGTVVDTHPLTHGRP